jgi:hypothetical protein
LQYEELMAESQDLRLKHGSTQENLPNRVEQRGEDREHDIRKPSLPSFKFNRLNENRIFRRHRIKGHRRSIIVYKKAVFN